MTLIFGFGLLGLVAVPALAEQGELEEVMADPEQVYLITSSTFFHPMVSGLLLSAVIAAVMSAADSHLLLGSAVAIDDRPFIRRVIYIRSRHELVSGWAVECCWSSEGSLQFCLPSTPTRHSVWYPLLGVEWELLSAR